MPALNAVQRSGRHAFHERKQVVVVVTVGVRAHILAVRPAYDTHVRTLAVHPREEGVRPALDGPDHVGTEPFPAIPAKVGDAFVGVITRLFVDAAAVTSRTETEKITFALVTFAGQRNGTVFVSLTRR
jgi:hypothetical protein